MTHHTEPADRRYPVRFGIAAALMVTATLLLVLYVLPERYVISSGFRESGMTFPTSGTPFAPLPVVTVSARPLPQPPLVIPPGPAEIFWDEVAPLLRQERYLEAIEHFERYLDAYPTDRDARREYAITLLAAGREDDAVVELRRLLEDEDDFARRLLLARTLREMGRTSEAHDEYAALVAARSGDVELWLEWAQAHAWIEHYDEAAVILGEALQRHPDSMLLRVELARVEFSRGRLESAAALLADLDDAELAAFDALTLRDEVLAALTVPEVAIEPPTLLQQALVAREEDDFTRAVELFEEAVRASPEDLEVWQAYADLLEYELGDLDGARSALLEVERLGPEDAVLQHRLAQLEIWTGRNQEARARLLALRSQVAADPEAAAPVTSAEIEAMLGDLERWGGDRVAAARHYQLALDEDPSNQRALEGMAEVQAEVSSTLIEVEDPRVAASSYVAADTDDYTRLDLGGQWVEVDDDWAWGGSAGSRWLDGRTLSGLPATVQQGVYVDLEAARWWRWATLRSAAQFGVQRVRDDWDFSVGASLRHRAADGSRTTELSVEHGPAYPLTATLQSALVGVVQDQLSLSHERRLGSRWSVSATGAGAWLRTDLDTIPNASHESTARLQGSVALGRDVSQSLALGLSASAMGYTSSGPVVSDPGTSEVHRLFWDPRLAISVGPFVRLGHDLSAAWKVTGRLGPGIALLDERVSTEWDVVPHVAADAGLVHEGERFWASLDLFFYQGQFDGYRLYGARLTLSARDWSQLGGGR